MPDKPDLVPGTLDMLVLKVVSGAPLHGYAIASRISQISRALLEVPQGSLYPALHRLENAGLLAATWIRTEGGRDAKVYRLTPKGRRHLAAQIAQWESVTEAVGLILHFANEPCE